MTVRAQSPRQIEIARAVRGAVAGGLRVTRVEVDGPKIVLITEPIGADLPAEVKIDKNRPEPTGWDDYQ